MNHTDGRKNNEFNKQQHDQREAKLLKVYEAMLNTNGMSVKEIAVDFKISSNLARKYVTDLIGRNMVRLDRKEGKTPVYTAVNVTVEATTETGEEPPKEEPKPIEALEVKPDGKEFDPGSYIPCSNTCKPGDVVWISSRSGEGQFFRYLIITPWERKAMVLGVMLEGHPQVNLNDPYYVYIGVDPDTQKRMYADIRNNCQRGYKQFGERLMHVDKALFDDVKARLARSMGFDPCKDRSAVIERLRSASDKQNATMTKLREENERLKQDLKNSYIHQDEYKKAADDATELNRKLSDENEELLSKYKAINASCADLVDKFAVTNTIADNLKKENADLRQQISAKEVEVVQPRYDDDTVMGMIIDSEVKKTKIEVYEEEIKMLKQMVFDMIKSY